MIVFINLSIYIHDHMLNKKLYLVLANLYLSAVWQLLLNKLNI